MKNNFDLLKEIVEPGVFTQWQEVDVEIYAFTDLGIKVAINDEYSGLVYGNQVYGDYREGQTLKAYKTCESRWQVGYFPAAEAGQACCFSY